MKDREARGSEREPLWREEVSFREADEQYVGRRQFGRFLALTSLGMFVGNVWILVRSWVKKRRPPVERVIARVDEVPVRGVKAFAYPGPQDPCVLIRTDKRTWVAYQQKCTHLSCAVIWRPQKDRLECPCHDGAFAVDTGAVLQGPPPRPLPRVRLERRGAELVAVGLDRGEGGDDGKDGKDGKDGGDG
jgi:nitrite reductase/ring-hydroxylating ferredoxin subunit